MEFVDVVMKRRAYRRFEEGGVPRETIERIARLAQRAPSGGFSQGQRLVVVTDPDRRREVARVCGEEFYARRLRPVDQRVRGPVRAVRLRGDLPPPLSGARQGPGGRDRDRLADPVLVGRRRRRRCRTSGWRRSNEGLGCGFVGTDELDDLRSTTWNPGRVHPDRRHAGRPAAPGRPVALAQARLEVVRGVRPLGAVGLTRPSTTDTARWRATSASA